VLCLILSLESAFNRDPALARYSCVWQPCAVAVSLVFFSFGSKTRLAVADVFVRVRPVKSVPEVSSSSSRSAQAPDTQLIKSLSG